MSLAYHYPANGVFSGLFCKTRRILFFLFIFGGLGKTLCIRVGIFVCRSNLRVDCFGTHCTWKSSYETAQKVQDFFPLTSMSNLIKQPFQRVAMTKFPSNTDISYDYAVHFDNIVIVLFWTLIFIFSSYKLLKKRDL